MEVLGGSLPQGWFVLLEQFSTCLLVHHTRKQSHHFPSMDSVLGARPVDLCVASH